MLFIRKGPRPVFVRSSNREAAAAFLKREYGGRSVTFRQGIAEAREGESVVCITAQGLSRTRVEDAVETLAVPYEEARIAADLFSADIRGEVERVQLGPGLILLRVAESGEEVSAELKERYSVEQMAIEDAVSEGEVEDTVLLLTKDPLSKVIDYRRVIDEPLLMHHPPAELYWQLRSQGVQLITQNLANKEWYELRINIYDAADYYEVHYERLMLVFSDLDVGMVLGETWTKDHALALFSVLAYQVRLFTLETPQRIKRLLMALEYNEQGKRFVDMDLYYRNRKINKNDKGVRLEKGESQAGLREELFGRLSVNTVEELRKLELSLREE
jgi:hypothetical protein